MRRDVVPGGAFPDYALPGHTGISRALSGLQDPDPLILVLARGNYCSEEHTGEIEALSMWAGQSVGLARRPQPAAEVVAELASGL